MLMAWHPWCTQCRTVTVWEWTGTAADEGDEAAAWFSKYLEVPVRLVRWGGVGSSAGASSSAVAGAKQLQEAIKRGVRLVCSLHA